MSEEYTIKIIIEDGKEYEVKLYQSGEVIWGFNGNICRVKGPSYFGFIGHVGCVAWLHNNQLHRLDGPATIHADGKQFWYINDIHMTKYKYGKARLMLSLGLDKV